MTTSDRTVETRFTVDTTALRSGINQAKLAVRGYADEVEKQSREARRGIQSITESIDATRVALGALSVAAVYQTAQAVAQLASMADQAKRIDAYFADSFGVYTEGMRGWASELADAYGLAESQVEGFAARLNSAFIGAGQSAADAVEMSRTLTQMSYDLSVKLPYLELDEVQEMINDLAVGGGESALEKILPGLDEESLKAKAEELGILGDELTVQAKQAAAYALLMEEYGDDLGTYGEGADTASAAMRRMDASVAELSESLGTLLGPAVQFAADVLGGLAQGLDEVVTGINRLLRLDTGDGEVPADLDTITTAMGSLREEAVETSNTLAGLAGFDKLNLLNSPTVTNPSETGTDWENVLLEFGHAYGDGSAEAVDAMEAMWERLVEESKTAGVEMSEVFDEYFGWIEEEVGTVAFESFYAQLEQALRDEVGSDAFAEIVGDITKDIYDSKNAYEGDESPPAFSQSAWDESMAGLSYWWNEQVLKPMRMLGEDLTGMGTVWDVQSAMASAGQGIGDAIATVGNELNKFGSWLGGIVGFAQGGVFQPNRPVLGILGDNTQEVEVAAPYSVIVDAVREANSEMVPSVSVHVDAPEPAPVEVASSLGDMVGGFLEWLEGLSLPEPPEGPAPTSDAIPQAPAEFRIETGPQTLPDIVIPATPAETVREWIPQSGALRTVEESDRGGLTANAITEAVKAALRDWTPAPAGGSRDINLTVQLDGRTLSREVWRMMQNEASRRF